MRGSFSLVSVGALALAFALACGSGDAPAPATERPAKAGGKRGAGKGAEVPAAAGPPVDPLAGRSPAEVCADDALVLIRHPLADLENGGFQRLCCARGPLDADDARCVLDWPFSDVPSCTAWDHMRNAVYAAYGYPFQDERWKKEFASRPGYTRRDDFSPAWLSRTATENVEALKQRKANKVSCAD
jgi:hypothetical protein